MIITVALTLCHLVSTQAPGFQGEGDNRDANREEQPGIWRSGEVTVCHEEIMFRGEGEMQACLTSQPAVADWKLKSEYSDDGWTIARIRCIPGDYKPKDAI